jgi:hypothetical protein
VTTPTCRPGSRHAIVRLPNQGAMSNDVVMLRIERDLDLEDSRLEI